MKIIPYVRFLIAFLVGYNFIATMTIRSGDFIIEQSLLFWNLVVGLLILTFIAYLILESIHELQDKNISAKWLRYYGLFFELLYVIVLIVGLAVIPYSFYEYLKWIITLIGVGLILVNDINYLINRRVSR